jgi:hypothetical protein
VKYTHVHLKTLHCVPFRCSLHILKVFLCTDATERNGQFGVTAAEISRIPGFPYRSGNRSCSLMFFVNSYRLCDNLIPEIILLERSLQFIVC